MPPAPWAVHDHLRGEHHAVGHARDLEGVRRLVGLAADHVVGRAGGVVLAELSLLGVAGEDLADERVVEEQLRGGVGVAAAVDAEVDVDGAIRVAAGEAGAPRGGRPVVLSRVARAYR